MRGFLLAAYLMALALALWVGLVYSNSRQELGWALASSQWVLLALWLGIGPGMLRWRLAATVLACMVLALLFRRPFELGDERFVWNLTIVIFFSSPFVFLWMVGAECRLRHISDTAGVLAPRRRVYQFTIATILIWTVVTAVLFPTTKLARSLNWNMEAATALLYFPWVVGTGLVLVRRPFWPMPWAWKVGTLLLVFFAASSNIARLLVSDAIVFAVSILGSAAILRWRGYTIELYSLEEHLARIRRIVERREPVEKGAEEN